MDPAAALADPPSADHPSLMLAVLAYTVAETCRDARAPSALRHRKDVSDSHSDDLQALWLNLTAAVRSTAPKLAPITLRLVHPVRAALTLRDMLALDECPENPCDTLAATPPVVTRSLLLPAVTWPVLHCNDVSDTHSLCSQPVFPVFAFPESPVIPSPAPCIVTCTEPDDGLFRIADVLTAPREVDKPWLRLPTRDPAVTRTRILPDAPPAGRHRTDEADIQAVCVHPLCPAPDATLRYPDPRLAPCTVRQLAPVETMLPVPALLSAVASADKPLDMLPARPPTLITTPRLLISPRPDTHQTVVSELQDVLSHAEPARTPRPDDAAGAMLTPCTVAPTDPVTARFEPPTTLHMPESVEYADVWVSAFAPTDKAARRLLDTLAEPRDLSDVSDTHPVCSAAVVPMYPWQLYPAVPMPDPKTVMLNDPLAPLLA